MRKAEKRTEQTASHRYMYALPNAFTLSSLFAGFYAMVLMMSPMANGTFSSVCIALLIAAVFDGLDGRVARLTNTQSEFGMQMDSLVDLVSFGIAPALLVYKWALAGFGFWGMLVAFGFAATGASRLARFNVMESKPKATPGPSRYFVGLPIPLAAGSLVSTIMFHDALFMGAPSAEMQIGILLLTLVLSYLMVSNIRFRTFKDLRLTPQNIFFLLLLITVLSISSVIIHPALSLLLIFSTYVVIGILGEPLSSFQRFVKSRRVSY